MATKKKRAEPKRRSINSGSPRSYGEMYKNDTTRQTNSVATNLRTVVAPAAAATESVNWQTEYAYVLRDLRTLLLVSAVLFAVIIGASFFI